MGHKPHPAGKPMPPQEQPANEGTGNQDKNLTQDTQNTEQTRETHNTRQTEQTHNTDLTQALLTYLGLSAGSSAGGFSVGGTNVGFVATPTAPTPAGASVEAREARSPDRQEKATSGLSSQPRSRVVDCRPCNGCCGNRVGFRVPAVLYDLLVRVAEREGVPLCKLLGDDLCELVELVRGGSGRVGVSERGLSRRVQYKTGYLLKMVSEAGELGQVIDRLVFATREYLEYVNRKVVGEGEARQKVEDLARELGFSNIRDFALYLWWLIPSRVVRGMDGLITPDFVERRGPYVDVLNVKCVLPHEGGKDWSVHTTMNLPKFLRALITHFKYDHKLDNWRQVIQWVLRKPWRDMAVNQVGNEVGEVGREEWDRLTPSLRLYLFEEALDMLVNVLVGIDLVEELGNGEYRCRLDGVVIKGRFGLFKHLRSEHRDLVSVVRGLVKSLAGAGVVADESAE